MSMVKRERKADELVKRLRDWPRVCAQYDGSVDQLHDEAADAIEELSKPKWIKIESRPMDDEERKYYSELYGYDLDDHEAVIYCCQLPENGQEVLVCNVYGHIWLDTFDNDPDYGVGFETNGDMDGLIAWMSLPQPPEDYYERSINSELE